MKLALAILFAFALRAEVELPPNPPGFQLAAINLADDTPTIRQSSVVKDSLTTQTNDAPVRAWHGAMAAPKELVNGLNSAHGINETNSVQTIPLTGGSVTFSTSNRISISGVVDIEELSRAVALRRTTIPPPAMLPPPMPPGTNTNESATMRAMNTPYVETRAQRAQRMFFEQGGAKGERPTIIPGRIIWK